MRTSSPGPPGRADAGPWLRWLFPAAIAAGLVTLLALPRGAAPGLALTYTQFLADVGAGTVRAVTISPAGQVTGSLAAATRLPPPSRSRSAVTASPVTWRPTTSRSPPRPPTPSSLLSVLIGLLPLLLFGGLLYLGIRRLPLPSGGGLGQLNSLAKAKARVIDAERPVTRFTDVAGYGAVKTEISEVVDYLRDPGRGTGRGRAARGGAMAGPPGTGKTLLALAVAREAHVPSSRCRARVSWRCSSAWGRPGSGTCSSRPAPAARRSCSSMRSMPWAPAATPAAWRQRRAGADPERAAGRDHGFEDSGGVVVLAATNRPDALDPALRRPGRFDREVLVPLPGRAERAAILASHARGKDLGPDADLDQVAAATPGFSGADLADLVNEAAVTAVRDGRTTLAAADFAAARDRVLLGTRHASPLAPAELATVAVHEAGHALVATLSSHANPVSRVTVLGAGQALGLTETLPADDRRLCYGERYLADTLAVRRQNRGPGPAHQPPGGPRPAHRRPAGPGNRHRRPGLGDRPGQKFERVFCLSELPSFTKRISR